MLSSRAPAHTARIITLISGLMIGCTLCAGAMTTSDQTEARVANAMQTLDRYNKTHSPVDLEAAIRGLLSSLNLTSIDPKNYIARRRTLVEGWARILHAIEQSYDPTFNPNNPDDLPERCVTPPREPDGRNAPSCSDPRDVHDPKARAEYIEALQKNDEKVRRVSYYHDLHNIDDEAMASLEMQLRAFSAVKAPPDSLVLDNILQEAGINNSRRTEIDGWLRAPTTQER